MSEILDPEGLRDPDAWILIEAPSWGDVRALGAWLLACAEAQAIWELAVADADFEKQVESLLVWFIPDFGSAGCSMVTELKEQRTSFAISLHSELGELFVMMAGMGFFAREDHHYKMVTPITLTEDRVKLALLRFAMTEDDEYVLHPEHLVTTMPLSEAKACQHRRLALDRFCNTHDLEKLPRA